MAVIKNKDFIEVDAINKSLASVRKNIDETTKSVKALQQATRKSNDASTGADAKKAIETTKQLDAATRKLIQATSEEAKQIALLKVATQQQNKETKEAARNDLKLVDASEKLNKERTKAQKLLKNNIILFGQQSKATKKAQQNFDRLDKKWRKVNKAAKDGRGDVGRYGIALKGLGSNLIGSLGIVGGFTALFSILGSGIKIFKDFSKSTSKLASILGKTKGDISGLTEQAKKLGSTTAFTASEVVSLQTELAKLGFSVKEIENSTEGILNLAAATGQDLATSAELAGSTLRIFNLDASEMGRVTDVLAKSTTISSLSMEKLATIMPTVGKTAQLAGVSLERTASLAGTLTDRGLDASTAATSLRNIFLELSKKGLTWNQAMSKINNSTDKNKAAMDLFGKRAAAAGSILAETADSTDILTESLKKSTGAAKKMADEMLDNLAGDITKAQSAWEGFVLSLESGNGVISKTFRAVVSTGTGLLQMLTAINTEYINTATKAEAMNDAARETIPLWDLQISTLEVMIPALKRARIETERIAALRGRNLKGLEESNDGIKTYLFNTEMLTGAQAAETRELIKKLKNKRELTELNKVENALLNSAISKLGEYTKFQNISTEADKKKITTKRDLNAELRKEIQLQEDIRINRDKGIKQTDIETDTTTDDDAAFASIDKTFEIEEERAEAVLEVQDKLAADRIEKEKAIQEALKDLAFIALDETSNLLKDGIDSDLESQKAGIESRAEIDKAILKDQLDKGLITKEEFAAKSEEIDKKARTESAKAERKAAIYKIGIDTSAAIVKALASSAPPFNFINAALVGAAGLLQGARVAARPLPVFEKGGEVGGKPHSQGGTLIEAQKGEYVVNKEGYANAPVTTDMINRGLMTDEKVFGMTNQQSDGLKASMLMRGISEGNKISNDILTALLNGGYGIDIGNMVVEKRASGEIIKYPKQ